MAYNSDMAYLPLAKHKLLHDGDLQDTVNIGSELFWRNNCQSEEVDAPLGAQFNGVDLGEMAIVYLTFGSQVSIDPVVNHQHLIVQTTLTGNSSTQNGKQFINTVPNDIAVIDPSLPTRITFEPGCAHLVLKIHRSLIANKLSELLRQQVNDDVLASDEENVQPRLIQVFFSVLPAGEADRLHHLDLEWFYLRKNIVSHGLPYRIQVYKRSRKRLSIHIRWDQWNTRSYS